MKQYDYKMAQLAYDLFGVYGNVFSPIVKFYL